MWGIMPQASPMSWLILSSSLTLIMASLMSKNLQMKTFSLKNKTMYKTTKKWSW